MSQPLSASMAAQQTQFTANSSRPHYTSSQSWTAGRCQRLLRPITSRIELLRKEPIRHSAVGNPDSVQTPTKPATVPSNVFAKGSKGCEEDDACWTKGRKRVRRTYSARCKPQDVSSTNEVCRKQKEQHKAKQERNIRLRPGEFVVPTPFLSRTKSLVDDSNQEVPSDLSLAAPPNSDNIERPGSRYGIKDREGHFEVGETWRRINRTTNSARCKVYEGIYTSLDALFKATILHEEQVLLSAYDTDTRKLSMSSSPLETPHSKSLFAMCLRGVPNHIKEEEKRFALEAEEMGQKSAFDTRLILAETYTDLESLGTSQMGWKHLETVVREHGVFVISDAIKEGLLDAEFASTLVMLCVHTSLLDQAETLLTSLLTAFTYTDPKSPQSDFRDDPTLLPLLTLERFVKYTGRVCYYHRQITSVITSGLLPVTWLGTRHFASIWTSLFRSLSTDPFNREAIIFITRVLPLLCRVQSSSFGKLEHSSNQNSMLSILGTTLASVLTALLAMSMLSASHSNILQMLKTAILDCQLVSSELHSYGGALVAMANLLGGIDVYENVSFLKQLVRFLESKPYNFLNSLHPRDRIPSFICSIARCCGRGSSGDGLEHLQIMLDRLMTFASLDNSDGTGVLKQIVVDSAFLFADHFPNPKHVQYAQNINKNSHKSFIQSNMSPIKGEVISKTGFRWEEGINEWVMATPCIKLRGFNNQGASAADEDFDCESPIRPRRKRCQPKTTLRIRSRFLSRRCSQISDLAPDSPKEYGKDIQSQAQKNEEVQDESILTHRPLREVTRLTRPISSRRHFAKIRRFGCEPLYSTQNWLLFDHSGDELNSTTETSSGPARDIFRGFPNTMSSSRKAPKRKTFTFDKPREAQGGYLDEQSGDELRL